jgi:hypothetical protein
LAGHRQLVHSTSTARELDEQRQRLDQWQRALKQKEAETAHTAEATRALNAELLRREQAVREEEQVTPEDHVLGIIQGEIESLPEVTVDTILRIRGVDYRIEDGRLIHLYWPEGQKTEFADGQWFQFGGRAYRIHDRRLRAISASTILAKLLGEQG